MERRDHRLAKGVLIPGAQRNPGPRSPHAGHCNQAPKLRSNKQTGNTASSLARTKCTASFISVTYRLTPLLASSATVRHSRPRPCRLRQFWASRWWCHWLRALLIRIVFCGALRYIGKAWPGGSAQRQDAVVIAMTKSATKFAKQRRAPGRDVMRSGGCLTSAASLATGGPESTPLSQKLRPELLLPAPRTAYALPRPVGFSG